MVATQELSGLEALAAATRLCQRIRRAHPTDGTYEAADLQWWWRRPRATDTLPQRFWTDPDGEPVAAALLVDWGAGPALLPILLPDARPQEVARVLDAGLAVAAASGIERVLVDIQPADVVLSEALRARGFASHGPGVVEAWLAAAARPPVSPLPAGYRAATRAAHHEGPHHLVARNGPEVEARLHQASLYRPDLDLVVVDAAGDVAAYGLFWLDPVSRTGLVEPMRTEAAHQRRGLARHVLTNGVERLAALGAERIKICYEADNPASGALYRDVGFVPLRETRVLSGLTVAHPLPAGHAEA